LIFRDVHLVQQQPHRPVLHVEGADWTEEERAPVMSPSPPEITLRTFIPVCGSWVSGSSFMLCLISNRRTGASGESGTVS
jgi:hypothetical protein